MGALGGAILGAAGLGALDGGGILGGAGTEGAPDGATGEAAAPFTPIANIDPSISENVTLSGIEITDIIDRSASGNDMTRVTEGPDLVSAWQNGRDAMDISSISAGSRGLRTGAGNPSGFASGQGWTIGFVADIGALTSAGGKVMMGWYNGSLTAGWGIIHTAGIAANLSQWAAGPNMNIGIGTTHTSTGVEGPEIYIVTYDLADDFVRTYVDGDASTPRDADDTLGTDTGDASSGFHIGGDSGLGFSPYENAILGEVVIYGSLLDSGDRSTLFDYLNDKWAVF